VLGRDPPGKSPADRDAHALSYLFLQPGGRGRDQLPGGEVQQQHGHRVGPQDFPDAVE
jgi:hypothetical protein